MDDKLHGSEIERALRLLGDLLKADGLPIALVVQDRAPQFARFVDQVVEHVRGRRS